MDAKGNLQELSIKDRAVGNLKKFLKDQAKIDSMIARLDVIHGPSGGMYYHTLRIISFLFYQNIEVWGEITENVYWDFIGQAGGMSSPGMYGGFGNVYTDDIDKLHTNTKTFFMYSVVGVYSAIYFYDKDQNLLGHFQAAFGALMGSLGGTGHWDKVITPTSKKKK